MAGGGIAGWTAAVVFAAVVAPWQPRSLRAQHQSAAGSPPVTLFGEVRARSEWDSPGGGARSDLFTYLRSRLGVRIDPTATSRIVLQLQDSRVLGTSEATTPPGSDVLDLHQGYLELTARGTRFSTSVRAGRQEIALGNERLVGSVGWSNTGQTFDGLRLTFAPTAADAPWTASVFATTVEERGRRFGSATPSIGAQDHGMVGAYGTRRVSDDVTLDATLLYDDDARYRSYTDSRRATVDARLRASRVTTALPIGVELEGAYQFGRQRYVPASPAAPRVGQDVGAWLVGTRVGRFAQAGRRASAVIGVDYLSGDATPSDYSYSAFATMYATNHPLYGTIDVIGDPATSTRERGLVDLLGAASFPVSSTTVKTEVHRFLLATGATRSLGWEVDTSVPVVVLDAGRLEIGYSVFAAQAGAATVGLAADGARKHWLFAQLAVSF